MKDALMPEVTLEHMNLVTQLPPSVGNLQVAGVT